MRIGTALAALLLVRTIGAQTLDRSRRPVAPPAAPFRFPAAHEQTLKNGLRVIVIEDHALPLVVARVVLAADSLADPAGHEGLFALDTAMLREGTLSKSADDLTAATATLGNPVSPLRFTTITQNFNASLALMADMLLHPAFPAAALDRQKAALVAAQQAQRQVAATLARRILFTHLFGAEHPMARSVIFSAASVQSITRDDVVRFHDTFVRPNTTTLIIVGDVTTAAVIASVTKTFGSWPRGGQSPPATPAPPSAAPTTIYLLDRPGVQQTLMFVGALGPDRSSADFASLETMGQVLGATPASRLQQNLRERHSYMYSGVPAAVVWRRAPMPSMIYGSVLVPAAKADSVLIEWMSELRGITERAPSEQEMTLARGSLLGTLPAQIETDAGIAERAVFLVQNGLLLDFYSAYVGRIGRVSPNEVRTSAARTVDPAHMVIVMAGDRATMEPRLRAAHIAPIVVVDENGNRVP